MPFLPPNQQHQSTEGRAFDGFQSPQFSQSGQLLNSREQPETTDMKRTEPIIEGMIYQLAIFVFTYVQILLSHLTDHNGNWSEVYIDSV